jgi:hypothetical protein
VKGKHTVGRERLVPKQEELFVTSVNFRHLFVPKFLKRGDGKGGSKGKESKGKGGKDGSPRWCRQAKRAGRSV